MKLFAICSILFLSACMDDVAIKTFSDATKDVNEGFAMGKRLRDRCASTNDIDHCQAWLDYKRTEEADNSLLDYDKALARWEAKGPY
ncbi:MAG: hypothetical protein ACRBBV_18105 [Paracoccaceae bacterium]